jgi:thioredoxin reductase (NADPH)
MERFIVTTNKGTKHQAKAIAIAGGLGTFEPRKPILKILNFMKMKEVSIIL